MWLWTQVGEPLPRVLLSRVGLWLKPPLLSLWGP